MRWQLGDDAFRAMLRERVGAVLEDLEVGLPRAERPGEIAQLEAEREQLREDEERVTIKLEQEGYLVDRRVPNTGEDLDRLLSIWNAA